MADLFCSAGGLTLSVGSAAAELGFGSRSLLAADMDARALQVYRRNFGPTSSHSESVTDLVAFHCIKDGGTFRFTSGPTARGPLAELPGRIDTLVAGPPCQGHSGFNNKSRRTDPRNSLYLYAVAAAIAVRARTVVIENVPQVVRSSVEVIAAAKDLFVSAGYFVDDGVLAADSIGWPQTRKRHFLVASTIAQPSLRATADKYAAKAPGSAEFLASIPKRYELDILESSPIYNEDTVRRFEFFRANPGVFDLPLSERPECHRDGTTYTSVYGRMRPDDSVPTLTSGFMTPGRGRFIHPTELRTLTPGEAAFVQGFPAWFRFDIEPVPTRSELAKWIGDAVPSPLGFVAAMSVLPGLL